MAKTFRSILRFLVPSWLNDEITQSHADVIDESMDRARAGLEARFPSRAQPDALLLIGQDRGIPRGRTETDEHYAERLIGWRYPRGHRVRGSAFALLNQVSEYFGGVNCWTIDVKHNRHDRQADGTESFTYGFPWNWDGTTSPKGRFWINLSPLGAFNYELEDVQAIRRLFTGDVQWRPGGTQPEWVIVSTDGSTPFPLGNWLHWSQNVAGTQVETRDPHMRFWSLAPTRNNVYAGDPTNFPALVTECQGGTYAGNPASFPALATRPSGGTYAGDSTKFPATAQLFDDGDLA